MALGEQLKYKTILTGLSYLLIKNTEHNLNYKDSHRGDNVVVVMVGGEG